MMKRTLILWLAIFLSFSVHGQQPDTPYTWDWKKDGPWLGLGFGGSAAGLLIGKEKTDYTVPELVALDKKDLFFADRFAAGYYSESLSKASDYPFYSSFALPFALLFDDSINNHSGQVIGLYIESLVTTSAIFTITAGFVDRPRPLVFSEEAPLERRLRKTSKRSFYSGHVAASATALFFAAKVYGDFHPDSPLRPYLWASAFIIPAGVGYLRLQAGKHYLTDIILGYGLGTLTGYLVPHLHKRKDNRLQFSTSGIRTPLGDLAQGLALRFTF
jgi:membrane-associated phospholipid phosphatase